MRQLEIVLSLTNLITCFVLATPLPRTMFWIWYWVLIAPLITVAQVLLEGPRWQMIPAYALTGLFLLIWLVQQYAVTLGPDRSVQLASIVPNPWPTLPEVITPMHLGTPWKMQSPHNRMDSTLDERDAWWTIDRSIAALLYTPWSQTDYTRIVAQLIQLPDTEWAILLSQSALLRANHRQYILDNPGCISDQIARQTWLTRLVASRGGLIEEAIFLREERRFHASGAIQTLPPRRDALVPMGRRHGASAGPAAPLGANTDLAPREPTRDQRTLPDPVQQPDSLPPVGAAQ